jgi:hypothetical protein
MNGSLLETSYSTSYAENFINAMETLPNMLEPYLSEVQRLDIDYYGEDEIESRRIYESAALLTRLNGLRDDYRGNIADAAKRQTILSEMQQILIYGQQNGDAKLQALATLSALAEAKKRQLDSDLQNFRECFVF